MKETEIPKNMGYGEGGETLPKLGKILQCIVDDLNDIAARAGALEDEVYELIARVEALEGKGGGDD